MAMSKVIGLVAAAAMALGTAGCSSLCGNCCPEEACGTKCAPACCKGSCDPCDMNHCKGKHSCKKGSCN